MATIDNLIASIPYEVSASKNVRFTCPRGTKYRIVWESRSGYTYSGGPFITLAHNGLKFPIGTRVLFNNYDDAYKVAKLWFFLINTSTTWYKPYFTKFYIVDTDKTVVKKTGTHGVKVDTSNLTNIF